MNRRGFLKGVFAAGAASLIPVTFAEKLPEIHGDGIHDDTAGIQAAIDRKPFICKDGAVSIVGGLFSISGGAYKISKQIHITGFDIHIGECTLIYAPNNGDDGYTAHLWDVQIIQGGLVFGEGGLVFGG